MRSLYRRRMRTLSLVLIGLLFGCEDEASSAGGGPDGGSSSEGAGSTTGGSPAAGGGSSGGAPGVGGGSTGGAPPCTATSLEEATRVTSVTISGASTSRALTAQAGAASVVAWAGSDGNVHVTKLDAVDQRVGEDLIVPGTQVFGVAATSDDVALLVARAPDFMTFVRLDANGAVLAETNLVGGGDHQVEGTEWFGEFAQTGRLARLADGSYAAYHALHRRWPDGIGHQGDTLRLFDANGAPTGAAWGWGCSHSMDQRLAAGPSGLVPICISDCYPGKGVYFNHSAALITDDPAANCAGGYTTTLGGLVATAAGFFLVYADDSQVAHLGAFDSNGAPVSDRTLSVAGSSRLAAFDDGLLLGASSGATTLQRLDATGADVGAPASIGAPLPDGDFEGRTDGEVAWASAGGTSLSVVRVRVCE